MARMNRAADSWPAEELPPGDAEETTLSVSQVSERIQGLLRAGFPDSFWLVGEASGLSRTMAKAGRSGHWYFQLADPDVDDPRRRPSLEVKCWRRTIDALFGPHGRLRRVLEPEDGIVLRVRVKVDYYAPRGQLSFTIEDVDPDFTLGNLDRQRRELLERLAADGALQANKARALCDVPLELGLVTSAGSAAHHDALHTLQASGIGFRIVFCDARTQGADTGPSVRAALAALGARPLDAILLVRGGGSRLDLSWFDKEDVARAIANCPLPVLTGIGHEIDTSVADAVAHASFKTPTAVAEFVVARAREARNEVDEAARWLADTAQRALAEQGASLVAAARQLAHGAQRGVGDAHAGLAHVGHRLAERTGAVLAASAEHLATARARLSSGVFQERLLRLDADVEREGRRLVERSLALVERQEELLTNRAERLRLLDPRAVLARGYAWLRRVDGRVLMDAGAVVPGETLTAVMRDGELPLQHRVAGRQGGAP